MEMDGEMDHNSSIMDPYDLVTLKEMSSCQKNNNRVLADSSKALHLEDVLVFVHLHKLYNRGDVIPESSVLCLSKNG